MVGTFSLSYLFNVCNVCVRRVLEIVKINNNNAFISLFTLREVENGYHIRIFEMRIQRQLANIKTFPISVTFVAIRMICATNTFSLYDEP